MAGMLEIVYVFLILCYFVIAGPAVIKAKSDFDEAAELRSCLQQLADVQKKPLDGILNPKINMFFLS